MARETDEASSFVSTRLDDRILTALQDLPGRVAFSGLKRVLRAHPESLARALRRLEREGLIERVDGGYRALAEDLSSAPNLERELRPIASIDLPYSASREAILARLSGRWFGSLRWVGVVDRAEERLLAWARRDGSDYVLLGIDGDRLRVYVPAGPSGVSADADDAAYELLVHAVDALRPTGLSGTSVTFYSTRIPSVSEWPREN